MAAKNMVPTTSTAAGCVNNPIKTNPAQIDSENAPKNPNIGLK
jgi:hypothetical protein